MNAPVTPELVGTTDALPRQRRFVAFVRGELLAPVLAAALLSGVAAFAWYADPDVVLTSTIVLIAASFMALLFAASKLTRSWPALRLLLIEHRKMRRLRSLLARSIPGARVFDELAEAGADVDYVLVSNRGIFAVSVVFLPEHPAGKAVALFDGDFLRVEGVPPIREPVVRARHVARQLGELLAERMPSWQRVTGLMLVVGWEIRQPDRLEPGMLVVGAAGIGALLGGLAPVLDDEEIGQANRALTAMARDARRRRWYLMFRRSNDR
jgi:hypothetical protein